MNTMFVRKVRIDWNQVSEDSYLREIQALAGMEEICFQGPVAFFAGENGTGARVKIRLS